MGQGKVSDRGTVDKMIECRVQILWHGQVGLNEEKYIKPALDTGQGLLITLLDNGEIMVVPADKVYSLQTGRSDRKFRDQFGGKDYYLVYYKWVVTAKQEVLL